MAVNNSKKKKKRIIIFSVIGGVLILLIVLVIIGSQRKPVFTVQTEKITRRTITQVVTATGKIHPVTQVVINAEVSGEIIELPVKEGQRVKKGQLLARIKPDVYQAQYESALANHAMAEASFIRAESDFKRVSELFAKNLVSQADMDVARANYLSAKAANEQAAANVRQAKETLSKTVVLSPMSGVVSQLNVEIGVRVSGSTFMQGTQLMTIADLSVMEARVDVGENDVVLVNIGDTARIEVDAFPDREFIGTVTQIANTAKSTGLGTQDQVTNFEVRILLHTPPGIEFRPGMSVTADIETATKENVFAVPIQSVTIRLPKSSSPESDSDVQLVNGSKKKQREKLQEVIFVVKNGEAKTVPVTRGISDDTYVEVSGENLEGLEVITAPFKAINRDLEDGSKVRVDNKKKMRTGTSIEKEG
ncbi:MAG: efflux RND transporter periplasmic adaptor subunit [Bacteroidetes bacterium]|nr:efflux RND transporter periplasmic adaptor subunit [Bacteroidota bacterium]